MKDAFRKLASKTSVAAGNPWTFFGAIFIVVLWALSGKFFGYSDTWQLVINTSTTIVTFLMVFLIQNTQNRDAKAMHLKLDELLKAVHGARTSLVSIEELSDDELESMQREFDQLHARCVSIMEKRGKTVGEIKNEWLDEKKK
jgi:low affinity Fe/Cu permease